MLHGRNWMAAIGALACASATVSPMLADYPTQIEYREAVERLVTEADLNSGGWSHGIDWIAESGDGSKVCFWTLASKSGQPNQRHFFIVNSDGTNLRDITPVWSENENPRWPRLNHDGSRMFYVAEYHHVLRYINTSSGQKVDAVPEANEFYFRFPYVINSAGTRAFFMDWNASGVDCGRYGVAYADIPGNPVFIYTMANLPYDDYCNKNRIGLLGVSDTGRAAVSWSIKDYAVDGSSMFLGTGGSPARTPNELVNYVYSMQDCPHRIISRDGNRVLYHRGASRAGGGTDWSLELIEPDAGTRNVLVNNADVERPCISPDGSHVRYNDPIGAYATLMLVTPDGTKSARDTISYFTPLLNPWNLTDICDSNTRWFGFSSQDWGAKQKLYRYEISPEQTGGGSGNCPIVSRVSFSHNALLNDEETKITAYVAASDPQGLTDIDWVLMTSLIDYGREAAPWDTKGRTPLSTGGDMGHVYMSDAGSEGEFGDETAGDGVYTFAGFWTRSYSDFWEHYASEGLPIKVPIRVIVKDKSDNYAIVDTQLTVTDDPAEISGPGDPNDGGDTDDDGTADDDGDTNDDGTADDDGDTNDDGTGDTNDDDTSADDNGDSTSDGTFSDPNDSSEDDGAGLPTGGLCPSASAVLLSLSVVTLLRKRRPRV